MRFFGFAGLAFLAVSACTFSDPTATTRDADHSASNVLYAPDTDGVGDVNYVKAIEFSGDTLMNLDRLSDLVRVNFALERKYQDIAIKVDQYNHAANGTLLVTALGIALGSDAGDAVEATARRMVWALGVNEAVRYANPAQMARAFRIAAQDSLCLATAAAVSSGGRVADNAENRVKLIAAMRWSHSNLRTRLSRPRKGFRQLLAVFEQEEAAAVEIEDKIDVANDLKIAQAAANGDDEAEKFFACLK